MRPAPENIEPGIVRLATSLALIMALCVAAALPGAYFYAGRMSMQAELEARANLGAIVISEHAMRNPDLWTFENSRIRGRLMLLGETGQPEMRRVLDADGRLVAWAGEEQAGPVLTVSRPIQDFGVVIGRVEVERSLLDLGGHTASVAFFSVLLAGLAFVVLRTLPLRLLARALARAAHSATYDSLTGLPNRVLFADRLERALARGRREGGTVALVCLDLDHFKEVNDALGHAAGDHVLREAARRLGACVGEADTLARLGGDEFAIVQVGGPQPARAEALAGRVVAALAEPFDFGGHLASLGASVGVTLRDCTSWSSSGEDPSMGTLLQEADVALHRAKAGGRGTHRFFEAGMNQHLQERRALEADLREAVAGGQFRLHYQPQVSLDGGRIFGAEALIRWRHPVRGDVRPDAFIALAEETGLILPIGAWALREACREASGWPGAMRVAVNVSPPQFRKPGFVDCVDRALRDTGLAPSRLELEVTEGVLLSDTDDTLATLGRLRALGVTIAMDDFGTGYSSLGYLRKFPFDKIKIDRSFIGGLGRDPQAAAIVGAVLGMGRALGIRVNAEGVENERQAQLLREEGCEEVQGFLFGRPMPADEFLALLAREAVPPRAAA